MPSGGVFIIDRDGSNRVDVANGEDPRWSPDGTRIAYLEPFDGGNPRGIDVIDLATRVVTQITADGNFPAWSPDSTRIAYGVRDGSDPSVARLYIDDLATGTTAQVTQMQAPTAGGAFEDLDWSPDGSMFTYTWMHDANAGTAGHIMVIGVDGSNPHAVTTNPNDADFSSAWSPDGTKIAFVRYTTYDTDAGVYVLDLTTGSLTLVRPLVRDGDYARPSFVDW